MDGEVLGAGKRRRLAGLLDLLFPSILILSSNESEGIKGRQPVAVLYGESRPLGAAAGARQGQGGIGMLRKKQ